MATSQAAFDCFVLVSPNPLSIIYPPIPLSRFLLPFFPLSCQQAFTDCLLSAYASGPSFEEPLPWWRRTGVQSRPPRNQVQKCWDRGRYLGKGELGSGGSWGKAGLDGKRILPKVPRKRTPECKSSVGLLGLRNGGDEKSIPLRWRCINTAGLWRCFPGKDSHGQGELCLQDWGGGGSSRKASRPDTGPQDKKSLSPWDAGKGLVCAREGAKARMCMYAKLSGNKQGAPPKLIREGHLLCAARTTP